MILALRDLIFEVLGGFWRGLIFEEFLVGQKSFKNPENGRPWAANGDSGAAFGRPGGMRRAAQGGKEGTSPSGSGDFGFDSVIQFKTPCTWRGAADTFS